MSAESRPFTREIAVSLGTATALGLAVFAARHGETNTVRATDLGAGSHSPHTLQLEALPPWIAHSFPDQDEPTTEPKPAATESSPATPRAELDDRIFFPIILVGGEVVDSEDPTVAPTATATQEPSSTPSPEPSNTPEPSLTPPPEPSSTPEPSPTAAPPSPTSRVPIEVELNGAIYEPIIAESPKVELSNGPTFNSPQYTGLGPVEIIVPGSTSNTGRITEGAKLVVGVRPIVEPVAPYVNENNESPEVALVTASGEIIARPEDESNWSVNGGNPCDEIYESDGLSGDVDVTFGARESETSEGIVTEAYVKLDGSEAGYCEETIVFPPIPDSSETSRTHYVSIRLSPNTGGFSLIEAARLIQPYEDLSKLLETEEGRLLLSLGEGSHNIAEIGRPYMLGTADRFWLDPDALEALIYGEIAGVVVDRGDVRHLDNPQQPRAFEDLLLAALHNVNLQRIAMGRNPLTLMTNSWISKDGPSEVRRIAERGVPLPPDAQNEIRVATRKGLDELYGRYGHIPGFRGVVVDSVADANARYNRYTLDAPWGSAFGINARYKGLHADIFGRAVHHRYYQGGDIYAAERGILWSMPEYTYDRGNVQITREKARSSAWKNFAEGRIEAGEYFGSMFTEDRLPQGSGEVNWESILRDALQRNLRAAPNILVIEGATGEPEDVLSRLRELRAITEEHDALLAIPGGMPGMSGIEMVRRLK